MSGKVQGIRAGNIHRVNGIAFRHRFQRGKQMLDRKIIGEVLSLLKLREYTAVNLYLPLSWAASTNWRVIQFVPITAKRIITRGYSIKGFCRQCSTPFSSSTCADTHYSFAGQPCSLNGPIMTDGPRYFGWRWRILASITALTRASFSRS